MPFLDHELVELAAQLPAGAEAGPRRQGRAQGGRPPGHPARGHRPAQGLLPGAGAHPPRGRLLDRVRDALHAPEARARGLFRADYVDALLADPNAELTPLSGNKLWQLALLEMWLQSHGSLTVTDTLATGTARPTGTVPAAPGAGRPGRRPGGARHGRAATAPTRRRRRGARLRLGPARVRPDLRRPGRGRRRAARRGGRRPGHLHLPARPARAGRPGARRAVPRPVAHLPAALRRPTAGRPPTPAREVPGCDPPAARRRRTPTRSTGLRPHGMVTAPVEVLVDNAGTDRFLYLVAEDGHRRDRRHRHRRRPRRGLRRPRGRHQPVVPGRRLQARAARRRRGAAAPTLAERLDAARPRLRRPVGAARQRRRDRALRAARLRPRAPMLCVKRKNPINERLFVPAAARGVRRAQPVRPDHRRRGAAARHPGRGARRRAGASCG